MTVPAKKKAPPRSQWLLLVEKFPMGLTPALSESTARCKENTKNQHYACLTICYASWYRLQREISRTMKTASIWVFNICSKYSSLFCTHQLNIWLNQISIKVEERYKWHKQMTKNTKQLRSRGPTPQIHP